MVKNNWYSIIPIKARYNLGTPGKPSYWNRSIHSTPKKGIVVSTHRFCGSRLSRTAPFSALLLFVSVMAARFFSLLIFSSARFCFHGKKEIKRERERSLRLRPICLATEQSAFLTRRRPASRHGADTAVIKILFFPSLSLFSLSLSLQFASLQLLAHCCFYCCCCCCCCCCCFVFFHPLFLSLPNHSRSTATLNFPIYYH